MGVSAETPDSTRFATPKYVLVMASTTPPILSLSVSKQQRVGKSCLVEAGLNQPGIGVAVGAEVAVGLGTG